MMASSTSYLLITFRVPIIVTGSCMIFSADELACGTMQLLFSWLHDRQRRIWESVQSDLEEMYDSSCKGVDSGLQ